MNKLNGKPAFKRLNIAVTVVFIAVCIYTCIKYALTDRIFMAPLGLAGILFLFINRLAERVLRIKLAGSLGILLKIYYLCAFVLGTALRWYDIVPHYDKIMHLLAGIVFALIGFCLFRRFDYDETPRNYKIALQIFFAFGVSMLVACIWEIFEFCGFLITGHDAQRHLTTGVFDTMGDIIACFIGSIIMCCDFIISTATKVNMPFTRLLKEFDSSNDFSSNKK